MKKLVYILTISFLMLFYSKAIAADEISLFDNNNNAVAYIAVDDDLTIYLWEGKPVAYLDGENVYGFNGKHLGWFIKGVIFDHDGDAVCAIKSRVSGYTSYEGYKSYKSYKPYKSYKEYAPYKPYFSNNFSAIPCSLALALGK